MQKKRRLLVIRASQDVCGQEVELIKAHAEMLGLEVIQHSVDGPCEMLKALCSNGRFDYFYLCSHGSREGFQIGEDTMGWNEFAEMVCAVGCLTEDSTFLMACCRGGLNRVAYDMLIYCPSIGYICGPSSIALPTDLTTAFVVFLTQIEQKASDQTFAAEKASRAIDRQFLCFDRNIVEGQADYQLRKEELEAQWETDNLEDLISVETSDISTVVESASATAMGA